MSPEQDAPRDDEPRDDERGRTDRPCASSRRRRFVLTAEQQRHVALLAEALERRSRGGEAR